MHTNECSSTPASTLDNRFLYYFRMVEDDNNDLPSYKLVSSKDPFEITGNSVIDSNDDSNDLEDKSVQSSELSANPSSSQISTQSSNEVYGDFNGDGFDDLAIGVGGEDVDTGGGSVSSAGAVNVYMALQVVCQQHHQGQISSGHRIL